MRTWLVWTALLPLACGDDPAQPPVETPKWQEQLSLETDGWLLSAWGPAKDDLYGVGGSPEQGRVMHFDGMAWSEVTVGVDAPLLNWVFGFGPSDLTIVGSRGTILHYDGTTFTKTTTITSADLWGVWGSAPDDLWAVGGGSRSISDATILRFDGVEWTRMAIPELLHPNVFSFFKVWGTSKDDVYVVGQRGVVLHWDGTALTELFVGASEDLVSLWGTGPDRIAIVGGRSNGVIATYDGVAWKHDNLAPLPGLNGVWLRDPNTVHIAGEDGTIATFDWTKRVAIEEDVSTRLSIHALYGVDGALTAIGGSLLSIQPPHEGVILGRHLAPGE